MSSSRTPISWTVFGATVIGNALEFFDFGVYAFFAVMIGKVFFPVDSPTGQLLLSFAAFGVGFIMRPIGAIVLGSYADRAGRRAALTATIFFMAAGTGLIAITPSYASIGVLAPITVVAARLLQGFSAGGEVGVATSYLVEVAPHGRRGMYGSLQTGTQGLANMAGAAMGFGLSQALSEDALTRWGWRMPFVFGLVIAPVGLVIRRQLPETADLEEVPRTSLHVIRDLLTRRNARPMLLCGLAIVGATISTYVLGHYITSYAMTVLGMPTSTAMAVAVASGVTGCVGSLLGGWLSDHVGRRWMMIGPRFVLLVLVVPVFGAIIAARTPFALIAGITLLTFFQATSGAALIVAMPECFPRSVRSLGVGVVYAVSVTIFGGSASAVATWLVAVTHSPMAPAWYLVVANSVSLLALAALKVPQPREVID